MAKKSRFHTPTEAQRIHKASSIHNGDQDRDITSHQPSKVISVIEKHKETTRENISDVQPRLRGQACGAHQLSTLSKAQFTLFILISLIQVQSPVLMVTQ